MNCGTHILLAHEMTGVGQDHRFGCEFSAFFSCPEGSTPTDLLKRGIYSEIAVALKGDSWREVGMILLSVGLCATQKELKLVLEKRESYIIRSKRWLTKRRERLKGSRYRVSRRTSEEPPDDAYTSTFPNGNQGGNQEGDVESSMPVAKPSLPWSDGVTARLDALNGALGRDAVAPRRVLPPISAHSRQIAPESAVTCEPERSALGVTARLDAVSRAWGRGAVSPPRVSRITLPPISARSQRVLPCGEGAPTLE